MLKNIPSILNPELLRILMEMGHGDELCIGDGNFPAAAYAQRLVRLDGHGVPEILDAILALFPLDDFVKKPAFLMQVVDPATPTPPIWAEYEKLCRTHESAFPGFEHVERFAFYEQAKKCYAIVATGETSLYANIILKKGVIRS
ncbi:MAG: fucose isomerase [Spirochaetaceae bacterium]|nr:MAG: fucose isomerase [Spirochaetaceae bacterium]